MPRAGTIRLNGTVNAVEMAISLNNLPEVTHKKNCIKSVGTLL
jgi:hypothetical protein